DDLITDKTTESQASDLVETVSAEELAKAIAQADKTNTELDLDQFVDVGTDQATDSKLNEETEAFIKELEKTNNAKSDSESTTISDTSDSIETGTATGTETTATEKTIGSKKTSTTKSPILRKAAVLETTETVIGGEEADTIQTNQGIQTRAIQTRATSEPLTEAEYQKELTALGLSELNQIIPSGQIILTTTSDKVQVNYQGTTTLADWLNIHEIPELGLTDTVVIYDKTKQTYSFASQITIAGTKFDLSGTLVEKVIDGKEQLDWEKLAVANIPVTDLKTSFPKLSLVLPATGTASLELGKGNIQLQYNGDIKVTDLLEGVVGTNLFIPEVILTDPLFSYASSDTDKQYKFQSGNLAIDYQNDLTTGNYSLTANKIPVGDLTSWLEQDLGLLGMGKLVTGTADLNFIPTNKSVSFAGSVDLSQLIKGMAKNDNLPIPSLNVENPKVSYEAKATGNIYDFTSDTITLNYQPKTDGTYTLTATKLPIGGLTSWANTQLGISNIGDFATGTVDVNIINQGANDSSKSIGMKGSVDVSALIKAVGNTDATIIPSLKLDNPTVTYQTNTTGKIYDFTSDTVTAKYQTNTDGTYSLSATQLPIGGLTSWMETQLGVTNIADLATGTVSLNIVNNGTTDNTKEISFSGSVDVGQIIKAITQDSKLPLPSLKLDNPKLSYQTTATGKVIDFTSDTVTVNYASNTDGTYKLTATQLPTGGMTSWLETQLGVTCIGNFVTGKANIEIAKTDATNVNTKVSFTGGVDVGAVVKAIAQDQNLPTPPLNVENPTFSYKAEDTGKTYNFTSNTIKVNYQTKTNGDYNLNAEELPTGGLTDWLETELGVKNISDAVTGNADVDLV
ncbi:MAG: hypothetical protein ACRC2J_19725, partial [Microcoleaceae cyanobacterium]